jgi:hypothetical protein
MTLQAREAAQMRVPFAVQQIITQVILKSYTKVVHFVGFVQGSFMSVVEARLFGHFVYFELQPVGHCDE